MHKFMSLTGLLLLTLSVSAFADTSAKTFIPKGWHEIANAVGDLNGDGRPDIAMALASDQEETATMDSAEVPLTGDSTDTNLITGDRIKEVTTKAGKSTTRSTHVARKPLVSISSPNILEVLSE